MENSKDYIYQYKPLWGEWYIDSLIGKGNYGSVYKITRDDWNCKQTSAVKVIYVEPNNNEIKNLELENFDEKSIKTYYKEKVQDIIKEIQILYKLKGCNNYETVKNAIEKTKTSKGLRVIARIIKKVYECGKNATEEYKKNMTIIFDKYLPRLNYRAVPSTLEINGYVNDGM